MTTALANAATALEVAGVTLGVGLSVAEATSRGDNPGGAMYATESPHPALLTSLDVYHALPLHPRLVREPDADYRAGAGAPEYEPEGSERRTLGSVSVAPDAHWAATLALTGGSVESAHACCAIDGRHGTDMLADSSARSALSSNV